MKSDRLYEEINKGTRRRVCFKQSIEGLPVTSARKIDEIDATIIKELLKDARKNFADIAKECGVSTTTISDHFSNLEKAGIIVGSTIQMNYKLFGYDAVADIELKVEPQQLEQVSNFIKRIPIEADPKRGVYGVYPTNSVEHNLLVVATLRSLKELETVKDTIKRQKAVLNMKTHPWIEIKNMPENLALLPNLETGKILDEKTPCDELSDSHRKECKVDEIDVEIATRLSENSRESFRKIAKEIGISTDTVARRYKKLTESGAIRACIQVNHTKIGYPAWAFIDIAFVSQSDSSALARTLSQIPDLTQIIMKSGDYDMTINVMIKSIEELLAVQDKIIKLEGITKVNMRVSEAPKVFPSPCQYISTF